MSGPDSLPIVKIKHPGGYAIINESDFVEGEHELFVEKEETAEEKAAREKAEAEAKAAAEKTNAEAFEKLKAERAEKSAPPATVTEPPKQAGWGVAPPPSA